MENESLTLLRLLLTRLERISADSFWAHRASGVRGEMLRVVERTEQGLPVTQSEAQRAIDAGFKILEFAARERVKW
jgi:hypothetical protein